MNLQELDTRIATLLDHVRYDEDRVLSRGELTNAENLKQLLRDVLEAVKSERLESNQRSHTHQVQVDVFPKMISVVTDGHSFNAAIDEMEAKAKELGL